MQILVGFDKVISKKNNEKYMILHVLDTEHRDVSKDDGTGRWGQTVEVIFVAEKDVEVTGNLEVGIEVRLLKEKNEHGFDSVSMIICKGKPGTVPKANK